MNIFWFLLSTLIVVLLGIVCSLFYIIIDKKNLFGGKKAGMLVGVIGGILGGYMFDLLFQLPFLNKLQYFPYIQVLLVNKLDINFIASMLGIWCFLSVYEYVSKHTERS